MNFVTTEAKRQEPNVLTRSEKICSELADLKNIPRVRSIISGFARDSIKRAGGSQNIIEKSYQDTLPQLGQENETAKTMVEANMITQKINPSSVTNSKLYKLLPFDSVKKKLLRSYVTNVVSTEQQFKSIFLNLEGAYGDSIERSVRLEMQYQKLQEVLELVDEDIAVLEVTWERYEKVDVKSLSEPEKIKHGTIINQIARVIRDMETGRTAVEQFLVGINQTHSTEDVVQDSMRSILNIGPLIMKNAILLQDSIAKQGELIDVSSAIQETMGRMLVANAEAMEINAEQAAKLYNEPVIAIKHFADSHKSLTNAVRTFEEAKNQGTLEARKVTEELRANRKALAPLLEAIDVRDSHLDGASRKEKLIE